MKIVKVKTYTFEELSADAKKYAIEHMRDLQSDDTYWHEFVFDDAKSIGKCIGIEIKDIYFSGFYSQGDGACFTGDYKYNKDSVKLLKEYAPTDKELHRIVESLYKLQKRYFYRIIANVKHSGHYYHKYCTDFQVDLDANTYQSIKQADEENLIELLRDFMQWIYKHLETEYDYVNSDESITETIKINAYSFLSNGKMANCLDS